MVQKTVMSMRKSKQSIDLMGVCIHVWGVWNVLFKLRRCLIPHLTQEGNVNYCKTLLV